MRLAALIIGGDLPAKEKNNVSQLKSNLYTYKRDCR